MTSATVPTTAHPDEILIEHVRKYGQPAPIISLNSEIIDGRRLLAACHAASVRPRVTQVSEADAPALLFRAHPERAFSRWPTTSATEAMRLFRASLKEVAPHLPSRPKRVYPPRPRHGDRTRKKLGGDRRYNLRLSRSHEHLLKEKSDAARVSASDFVRAAIAIAQPDQVRRFFEFLR